MKIIDMKVDRESQEEKAEAVSPADNPYPYGLCLHLCEDEMEKLGLKAPLPVGTVCKIEAKAVVTATNNNERIGGKDVGMSIQIVALGLESGKKSGAKDLYPGMKEEGGNDY